MDECEEDLPAYSAAGRNGARARHESEEAPGFAPEPAGAWKLPVGEFIEECYWKRFGGTRDQHARGKEQQSRKLSATNLEMNVAERVRDPAWQLSDLACYLMNLADDLQQWLVHGSIDPEVLPQVREELRAIANALDTRAPISPIPAIPPPPRPTRRDWLRRGDRERAYDDEEIPF